MSREQIITELRARIEECRGDYQRMFEERRRLMETAEAAGANSDGMLALDKMIAMRDAIREAQTRYKSSTKAFGDYILNGKLPPEE